ncbi:RimK/LysX family protein [Nitrosomonas sp. Nm166]|uniref:ATP-dependent zinc protease family protein n=1 Tax=Nitrosomonas sp. Nm166 TaxID=1881054 RepID=UPI002108A4E7|nr:RimK/LysX family protein [Nitrosomonas sp. Nm166]
MLSACNPREDELSEREARISARESELVTLFAELVEQRKLLEKNQSDKFSHIREDLVTDKSDPSNSCSCNTQDTEISQKEASTTIKAEPPPSIESRTILGGLEYVYLDPPGMEFSARIDTGAQTSSLNALDIVEFERDGKPFVRFHMLHPQTGERLELTRRLRRHVRVKERGDKESQRRPVVRMRVILANIDEQINFTLVDRGRLKHQVLIGRNLLRDLAIVDVSKKFTTVKTDSSETNSTK